MNKNIIKIIRDKIPESTKHILSPFFRNKLLHNKNFIEYYTLLKDREDYSKNEIN